MIAFIYLNILSLIAHPSSLILHRSSFIAHPSSLILHRRFAAGWGGF